MENQDNNIKNDNKINNDSQLSEENNKQQNKKYKWVNKKNITIILTLFVVIIAGIFLFVHLMLMGEKHLKKQFKDF